ncbi:2-oxoadipate dioxygenase/decarboxylase family protein [Amycolatopsis sulphurea]|uniref:2-oxoadipate dioxygenase/decarboxylase family protein n=1 Tax=Amycolatopsis sulphurea TaxID=76022 RepID=UPI001B80E2C3|nr:DUF1338 family protein [Amycolatopsis sulphurea]
MKGPFTDLRGLRRAPDADFADTPPRWDGPDVLLRQTSFRALDEPRWLRLPDGSVTTGVLRVRFGEVEACGIALTRKGRARYDELMAEIDRNTAELGGEEAARAAWQYGFPGSERGLAEAGLAYFTYRLRADRPRRERPPSSLAGLLAEGWIEAEPVVYEDFLPQSAAGIFQSNLNGEGRRDNSREGVRYDQDWLSGAIEREIHDPFALYERQQRASITALHLPGPLHLLTD